MFLMFASFMAVAIVGLLTLIYYSNKQSSDFISELQFLLRQRIISHNREKARHSVLKTRFENLTTENQELKTHLENFIKMANQKSNAIVDEKTSELDQLELEITSIQEMLNGDIKASLSNYLKEVDGLRRRLGQAKSNISVQFLKEGEDFSNSIRN